MTGQRATLNESDINEQKNIHYLHNLNLLSNNERGQLFETLWVAVRAFQCINEIGLDNCTYILPCPFFL